MGMNKKILLIIIFMVSVLLVTVVVAGIHEKKPLPKGKKASPTPSITISPYSMPLPMMKGGVKSRGDIAGQHYDVEKCGMLHVRRKPA